MPGRIPRRNATKKSRFEAIVAEQAGAILKPASGKVSGVTTGKVTLWAARARLEVVRGGLPPSEAIARSRSESGPREGGGRDPVHLHELRGLRRRRRYEVPAVCRGIRGRRRRSSRGRGGHPRPRPLSRLRGRQRFGPGRMRNLRRVPPRPDDETGSRRCPGAGPRFKGPGTRRDTRQGRRLPAGARKVLARSDGQTDPPREARDDAPGPIPDAVIALTRPARSSGDQSTGRGKIECPVRTKGDFGLAESPAFSDPPTDSRNATEASSRRIGCETGSAATERGPRRAHGAAEGHGNASAGDPTAVPLNFQETRPGGAEAAPTGDTRRARLVPRDPWGPRPRGRREPPPRGRPQSAPRQFGHRGGPPRDRRVSIGRVPSFADGTPESSGDGAFGRRSADRPGCRNLAGRPGHPRDRPCRRRGAPLRGGDQLDAPQTLPGPPRDH